MPEYSLRTDSILNFADFAENQNRLTADTIQYVGVNARPQTTYFVDDRVARVEYDELREEIDRWARMPTANPISYEIIWGQLEDTKWQEGLSPEDRKYIEEMFDNE